MMTLCRTGRGRIACGLGGLTIALLALGCLWAFSPAVTAGDGPAKKDARLPACPPPSSGLPDVALPPVAPAAPPPAPVPPVPPVSRADVDLPPQPLPKPPAKSDSAPEPPLPKPPVGSPPPPTAKEPSPLPPAAPSAPPPLPVTTGLKEPALVTPSPAALSDGQDIKQLLTRLAEIKSERLKLDERERQTIQAVKKKYQEQKHALQQLERELRQLGINCEDGPAS